MARWCSRGRCPTHTFHTCWKQFRYLPLPSHINYSVNSCSLFTTCECVRQAKGSSACMQAPASRPLPCVCFRILGKQGSLHVCQPAPHTTALYVGCCSDMLDKQCSFAYMQAHQAAAHISAPRVVNCCYMQMQARLFYRHKDRLGSHHTLMSPVGGAGCNLPHDVVFGPPDRFGC